MGLWRVYKAGPVLWAALPLHARENNELISSIVDIDIFERPFYRDGKVARPRALQPQQHFAARCLQNQYETHYFK